jgi:excisionase family DNA binding protein
MEKDTTHETGPRLLSVSEACQRLGIGRWSLYKLIQTNVLRTVKIGRRRLISMQAVKDCIASLEARA